MSTFSQRDIFSYSATVSALVGPIAATIYHPIGYWIEQNQANERNFKEGKYWTYDSITSYHKIFHHFTEKQIRTALSKLLKAELLVSGNYNQKAYDKTKWYAFGPGVTQKPLPIRADPLPKRADGFAQKGRPIPDNKPDNNTDTPPNPQGGENALSGIVSFDDPKLDPDTKIAFLEKFLPTQELKDFAKFDLRLSADEFRDAMTLCAEYWRGNSNRKNGKKTPRGWKATIKTWLRKEATSLKAKWRDAPIDTRDMGKVTAVKANDVSPEVWEYDIRIFADEGSWRGSGPAPDQDGCLAPIDILQRHGYAVGTDQ